jgi:hypothetical protein
MSKITFQKELEAIQKQQLFSDLIDPRTKDVQEPLPSKKLIIIELDRSMLEAIDWLEKHVDGWDQYGLENHLASVLWDGLITEKLKREMKLPKLEE